MTLRRAVGQAAMRGLLVVLVAVLVVLIGLVVFNRDARLTDWSWRLEVWRQTGM